jgi:type IV pilus assembly protein PilB
MDTIKSFPDLIIDALLGDGLVKPHEVEEARKLKEKNGERVLDILVAKNFVNDMDMATAFGQCSNPPISPIALHRLRIPKEVSDLVPFDLKKKHHVVPVWKVGKKLILAMANPNHVVAIDEIKKHTALEILPLISPAASIENALSPVAGANTTMDEAFQELEGDVAGTTTMEDEVDNPIIDAEQMERDAKDKVIGRFVASILLYALQQNASDIHIEPTPGNTQVRYRIDGNLILYPKPIPGKLHQKILSRIRILSHMKMDEPYQSQSGRFRFGSNTRTVDLRVEIVKTALGMKIVMRILDPIQLPSGVDKLGLDAHTLTLFRKAIEAPYGMILLTGPTGSGKTTTLYTVLRELNDPRWNITTVEDPVEYQLPGMNQIQINMGLKDPIDFPTSLRSILRQDPDIIMVGEIRDGETARVSVQAAMTGHQILSTLHTNDSPSAIGRLIDLGVDPLNLSDSLVLIAAQRLVRRICPNCKTPDAPAPYLLERLGITDSETVFYKGLGCDRCSNRGYLGRVPIIEALYVTPTIQKMIGHSTAAEIKAQAIKEGMQTLLMGGIQKAREGITSLQEVSQIATAH